MRVSVTSWYEYLRMCHLLHVHIWVSSILFRFCIIIAQVSMGKWNAMSYSWDGMHVISLCHYRCIMFNDDPWRCLLLHDASICECVVWHAFTYESHQYHLEFASLWLKYSWRNGIRWGTHEVVYSNIIKSLSVHHVQQWPMKVYVPQWWKYKRLCPLPHDCTWVSSIPLHLSRMNTIM